MIPSYYLQNTLNILDRNKAKRPAAPQYGKITLFVEPPDDDIPIVDLASEGLNEPYDPEGAGLTAAQLNVKFNAMLKPVPPADNVIYKISKIQMKSIHGKRYKKLEVEI